MSAAMANCTLEKSLYEQDIVGDISVYWDLICSVKPKGSICSLVKYADTAILSSHGSTAVTSLYYRCENTLNWA